MNYKKTRIRKSKETNSKTDIGWGHQIRSMKWRTLSTCEGFKKQS